MRKFERIRVENGQAYIRDTGITVSQLASQFSSNQSNEQILTFYSNLQKEDLLEVIGYIVTDLLETIAYARNDGLSPLSSIHSAATLILDPQNQSNLELMSTVKPLLVQKAIEAMFIWYELSDWSKINYEESNQSFQGISLSIVKEEVLHGLFLSNLNEKVDFDLQQEIPLVRGNNYLSSALIHILIDPIHSRLKWGGKVNIAMENENAVRIKIQRQYSSARSIPPENIILAHHSHLALANVIIQRLGSELYIFPSNDEVIFQFNLPIWQENS
jgi:uncharacterized protein (DUF433 family)